MINPFNNKMKFIKKELVEEFLSKNWKFYKQKK